MHDKCRLCWGVPVVVVGGKPNLVISDDLIKNYLTVVEGSMTVLVVVWFSCTDNNATPWLSYAAGSLAIAILMSRSCLGIIQLI